MLLEEFEQLTGFYPDGKLYAVIEEAYMESKKSKQDFCKAYKENRDGLAETLQRRCSLKVRNGQIESERKISDLGKKIDDLREKNRELKEQLEKELEWKPYEMNRNVPQGFYDKLAESDARELSDTECQDLLYKWFGFAREKVTVIREVTAYEVNRHHILRKTGRIERKPLYFAADWNYIRFTCGSIEYEMKNGELILALQR